MDNGVYTNAAIATTLNMALAVFSHLGESVPTLFAHIAAKIHIAQSADDPNIFLEYTDMPASVVMKQADVVMFLYLLEYDMKRIEAATNIQYYAMKLDSFGPAMAWPIFSTLVSPVARAGCAAQSYLSNAAHPFLRCP